MTRDSTPLARHNPRAMVRHTFTPFQANRTLPLVRRIVADLIERGRERRQPKNARARNEQLEAEIRDLIGELHQIGCDYKDFQFDKGLVDFPCELEGRAVLLCWRSDEPEVAWYHAPEAGFAGRTPIPAHLLAETPPTRAR